MKKRIIALILVMTMVWGSMGDLFTGLSFTARADEQDLATPTDLSPLPQEGQRMTLMRSAAPGTGTDNDAVATTVLSTNNTAGTNNDAAATTVLSANNTAGTNNDAAAISVLGADNTAGTNNDTNTNNNIAATAFKVFLSQSKNLGKHPKYKGIPLVTSLNKYFTILFEV